MIIPIGYNIIYTSRREKGAYTYIYILSHRYIHIYICIHIYIYTNTYITNYEPADNIYVYVFI